MELILRRQPPLEDATIFGDLLIDGVWTCFTLEKSGEEIPLGSYPVTITPSSKFGRLLPLVNNVPGRTGIRIHGGNTELDTTGCILVGRDIVQSSIVDSRVTLNKVQGTIAHALASHEAVTLTIQNAPTVPVHSV